MNSGKKIKVNPEYTIEKFDNEILLYTEVGTQAVYLNDAAYVVWQLCNQYSTVDQVIDFLEKAYPDQKDQIREDVMSALNILESHQVIKLF